MTLEMMRGVAYTCLVTLSIAAAGCGGGTEPNVTELMKTDSKPGTGAEAASART